MRTIAPYAVFFAILCCDASCIETIDCVKFLRIGDERVCLTKDKRTSPSLAMEIGSQIYYASTTTENAGKLKFEYNNDIYSVYDGTEYELIHWLSGHDALVNNIWQDRITTDGAMNFTNHNCTWNDTHDGYYSADGSAQYFQTTYVPTLDFGTDWYIEITAQIDEPLGTSCFFVDFCSVRGVSNTFNADGLAIKNNGDLYTNTKVGGNHNSTLVRVKEPGYTFGDKAIFTFGSGIYSATQSRSFITFDGNRYYGTPYNTVTWNHWDSYFYLFHALTINEGNNIYKCGPTTIYDIKIWRKKTKTSE